LESLANIKFVGEGIGVSVLKFVGTGEEVEGHLFLSTGCTDIEWHQMTLDGNKPVELPTGTFHCIKSASDANFVFKMVHFLAPVDDGINITGSTNFHFANCRFENCGRYGIYNSANSLKFWVNESFFVENVFEDLYFEAIGDDPARQVQNNIITNNVFSKRSGGQNHSLKFFSQFAPQGTASIIAENIFINGSIWLEKCKNFGVNNNIIEGSGGDKPPLTIAGNSVSNIVSNNIVVNNGSQEKAIHIKSDTNTAPADILISGNRISNGTCHIENCQGLKFFSNQLNQSIELAIGGLIFQITENPVVFGFESYGDIGVCDNSFLDVSNCGILLECDDSAWKCREINISSNLIQSSELLHGIILSTPSTGGEVYWDKCLVSVTNVISECRDISINITGTYLIKQNNGEEVWISNALPENEIHAGQGALAITTIREADNNFCKNKSSGETGWELQSEVGK
ncbi:MAG: right-handed parallel beta-helix repeat-containing protein, partial [Sphingobacteriales bacterium]